MLATVCYRFGSWCLVLKLNFCSDFEHKGWSRFWSWSSGKILKLEFVQHFAADILQRLWSWILVEILKLGLDKILNFKFSRDADVWLRFWSWCLVEILKMKFDQDLCLNLWYELNSRVRCTLGNVSIFLYIFLEYVCSRSRFIPPADCYCLHTTARLLRPTERRGGTLSANKMIIVTRKRIFQNILIVYNILII